MTRTSSDELVHLEVARGVATISLDSPHNRNALSRRLVGDLERHLDAAIADPAVRVVLLTHTGRVFCSGADLRERREPDPAAPAGPGGLVRILTAMGESPKPIVGRIAGAARAGGLGLVAACDLAVAAEGATFALTEVRVGVIPAIVAVVLLPRIGAARATELFLTGEPIDARTAAAAGLVTAAVPAAELDAAAERYVSSLRQGAPGALAGAKRLVRDLAGRPIEAAAFAEMAERSARFFASDEAREGLAAFAEKRPPSWTAIG